LLTALLTGVGVILIISFGTFYFYVERTLAEQFDRHLEEKVLGFAQMGEIEDPNEEDDGEVYEDFGDDPDNAIEFEFAELPLREYQASPDPEYYQVWDDAGVVLARSPSLLTVNLAVGPHREANEVTIQSFSLPDGRAGKAASLWFSPKLDLSASAGSDDIPKLRLVIAKSTEELDQTMGVILSGLIGTGLIGLCVVVVCVVWAVRHGLLPLDGLRREIDELDVTRLDGSLLVDELPPELRPIAACLNDLMARMEKSFQRERHFNSNVAHELRTPISELLALSEASANREHQDEETRLSFMDTKEIADRMHKIVQSLLEISRCEAGLIPVEEQPTDMDALLKRHWNPFISAAEKKGIKVSVQSDCKTECATDSILFGTVLTNVFSNAVSYTPENGAIDVEAETMDGQLSIRVTNTTDGFQAADIDHIFDTFWRHDPARSDESHLGMGLSLVQAIASILNVHLSARLVKADTFELEITKRTVAA
jgi:two-component system sensor histidine kinase QseC